MNRKEKHYTTITLNINDLLDALRIYVSNTYPDLKGQMIRLDKSGEESMFHDIKTLTIRCDKI